MNSFPIMVGSLCVLVLGYRYYSAFIAAKVLALDDRREMPSHLFKDGHNYVPMNKWVLFGHHFAAIAGAGPLVGPVLAAQFGYAPGLVWLLAGAVLAGCVHDFMILVASVRHNGRSLPEIARAEIGPVAGFTAGVAVLFIVVVALAGLGLVVVNALAEIVVGDVHDRDDDPDRGCDGRVHVQDRARRDQGADGRRGGRADPGRGRRALDRRLGRRGLVPVQPSPAHRLALRLWLRGLGAAGLAVAGAAGLPLVVHEDRHDRAADRRSADRPPRPQVSRGIPVRPRRGSDRPRQALPVPVHHDRVRGDLGVPLPWSRRGRRRRC